MKRFNMLRRLSIKGLSAVALLGMAALPAQAQTDAEQNKPAFSDVPPTHWAYNAVQRLAKAGIIEGYPLNTERHSNIATDAKSDTALIVSMIKMSMLSNPSLKSTIAITTVYIDATSTTVTLLGTVKSQAQKVLVEQIARRKAGNLKIINRLKVVGPAKH